jgi:nucleotide-binding universal stress UspA family protein
LAKKTPGSTLDAPRAFLDASCMGESKPSAKQWGIGVELAEDHLGPIRFAATLTQNRPEDVELGLHVVPDHEVLNPFVTHEDAVEIHKRAVRHVTEVMAKEGLAGAQVRVELVEDNEIARGLSEAAERLGLDALIVGRRAKRDEDPIVRLGEVTRRVLRRLPTPVIVVPPDYGQPQSPGSSADPGLGEGPIILATDLSDHAAPAARFAQELATRLDRELLLAHGTQAFHWGVSYIPAATMDQLQAQARKAAAHKLDQWAAALGIQGARTHVFMGDPAKHLLQLAYSEDAAMLVTGSRMLGPVERLFLASVSSEVAAAASCPVAVVPGSSVAPQAT